MIPTVVEESHLAKIALMCQKGMHDSKMSLWLHEVAYTECSWPSVRCILVLYVIVQDLLVTCDHREMPLWMLNLNSTSLNWRRIQSTWQWWSFAESYQVTRCNR